jgi:hypothetical protein
MRTYLGLLNTTLSDASTTSVASTEAIKDYSVAMGNYIKNGGSIDDSEYKELESARNDKIEANGNVTDVSTDRLTAAFEKYKEGTLTDEQKNYIDKTLLYDGSSWFTDANMTAVGLATGGYTGEWGPEGKLAFLH